MATSASWCRTGSRIASRAVVCWLIRRAIGRGIPVLRGGLSRPLSRRPLSRPHRPYLGLTRLVGVRSADTLSYWVDMSYPLRWIQPGRLYETTSRAIHSRLLLRPSDELNTIINGILAKAVEKYDVQICDYIVLSNHMHMLLIPGSADQMRRFMNFVNGNIAKEGGRLHGWKERFWGRRYRLIAITNEPEAQIGRLKYLLANGCKEGLVRKPEDWPGARGLPYLLKGVPIVGHWFNRTAEYRARRRGEKIGRWDFAEACSFELEPLPCWKHLPQEERQRLVLELVKEIEQETRERLEAEDRSPMGARRVLRAPSLRPSS